MSHPETDFTITIEELNSVQWADVLVDPHRQCCEAYSDRFRLLARKAHSEGADVAHKVYRLLGIVTSYGMDGRSVKNPFRAAWTRSDGEKLTSGPEDLSEHQRRVLEVAAGSVACNEFRARIYDVLWVLERKFSFALQAIDSYIGTDARESVGLEWGERLHRFSRARALAFQLKQGPLGERVFRAVESLINTFEEDPAFPLARFVGELLNFDQSDAPRYAAKVEHLARTALDGHRFHDAESLWRLTARWHDKIGDDKRAQECLVEAAECFVRLSDTQSASNPPQILASIGSLEEAIESFRAIPGQKERVTDLHKRLLVLQRETHKEIIGIPSYEQISETTEAGFQTAPLLHLIKSAVVNQMGRVIARREPVAALIGDIDESAREAVEFEHLRNAISLYAQAGILPSLEVIQAEHFIREERLEELLRFSRFIPPGRLPLFVKGFSRFFAGDMFGAVAIVIPQIESSLRHVLESIGEIATHLNHSLIQDERTLNEILDHKALNTVLGRDVVFNLKGLLISRHGFNFRNRLSHGLLEPHEFYSLPTLFLVWLWFRICCNQVVVEYQRHVEFWQQQAYQAHHAAVEKEAYYLWQSRVREGREGTAEDDWKEAEISLLKPPLNC